MKRDFFRGMGLSPVFRLGLYCFTTSSFAILFFWDFDRLAIAFRGSIFLSSLGAII